MRLLSTLPLFLPSFAKLGLDTLSTSVRVFFLLFFFPSKVLEFRVFGRCLHFLNDTKRTRESPREREKRVFEEEEEEKEVK